MKVTIEPYNPAWAEEFLKYKATLLAILGDVPIVGIEHVGSTSIPGMAAKPVLDVDIIITPAALPAARAALVAAGYLDCGEMGIIGRHVYRQPGYDKSSAAWGTRPASVPASAVHTPPHLMRRNTYLMIDGCSSLANHLAVKQVLTRDAALRDEYAAVKRGLATQEFDGIGEYGGGKSAVLRRILDRADLSEEHNREINEING